MNSNFIEVPYTELSKEALQGLVEAFIMREGTDYGEYEYSLEQKSEQVYQALHNAEAVICFDPITETCSIVAKDAI